MRESGHLARSFSTALSRSADQPCEMVIPRTPIAFVALASAALLAGCQTRSETFAGRPTNQVWTAMVKAAEQPDYKDWHVIENDVWTDEASGRIEIWRLLRRYKDPAGQWPRLEDSEWKLAIVLDPQDPPTATFSVRSMCVPSHSWIEAERYFDQVWTLLGGRPVGEPPVAESPASPPAAAKPAPAQPEQPASPEEAPKEAPKEAPVEVPN